MNTRRVAAAAGAAVVLMAGAAWVARLAAGGMPGADYGVESGYSPPETMVLVSADGMTLHAGYVACVEHAALQAVERPGSVLLRVYWRRHRGFGCGAPPGGGVALAAPSFDYQVRLSSPLGGRRLAGPGGAALPWLDEAAMLRFPSPVSGRHYGYAASARSPVPLTYEPLMRAAKCLMSVRVGNAGRLRLEQCGYGGATPAMPSSGIGSAVPASGVPVTVRGRAGHFLDSGQNAAARALDGFEGPWRAVWWTQGNTIVILASERVLAGDPPPLPVSRLVAAASSLSCLRPAQCR